MVNQSQSELPEKILKTDLWQYGRRRRNDGPYAYNLDLDVLIVGAGFGGAYSLYEARKNGFKTVLWDAGLGFGGTCKMKISKARGNKMF